MLDYEITTVDRIQSLVTWLSKYYLLGEIDLDRDLAGLRIGERLRLRSGDLLGGLRGRLGGELRWKQVLLMGWNDKTHNIKNITNL